MKKVNLKNTFTYLGVPVKVTGIPYFSRVSFRIGVSDWMGILYLLRCLNIPFNPK